MSDPQDHSQSEFEEAQRFWGEYARRTRPGGQRAGNAEPSEGQNGHGTAAAQAHECLDWCPICRTADVLRASAPPELRDQVQGLQRDALVTLRALLDAYIERGGEATRERRDTGVEDIPID
jgi:hypothetical protein